MRAPPSSSAAVRVHDAGYECTVTAPVREALEAHAVLVEHLHGTHGQRRALATRARTASPAPRAGVPIALGARRATELRHVERAGAGRPQPRSRGRSPRRTSTRWTQCWRCADAARFATCRARSPATLRGGTPSACCSWALRANRSPPGASPRGVALPRPPASSASSVALVLCLPAARSSLQRAGRSATLRPARTARVQRRLGVHADGPERVARGDVGPRRERGGAVRRSRCASGCTSRRPTQRGRLPLSVTARDRVRRWRAAPAARAQWRRRRRRRYLTPPAQFVLNLQGNRHPRRRAAG